MRAGLRIGRFCPRRRSRRAQFCPQAKVRRLARQFHRSEFVGNPVTKDLSVTTAQAKPPLTANQKRGFFAAWGGWALDGMDSFIYALVMVPGRP